MEQHKSGRPHKRPDVPMRELHIKLPAVLIAALDALAQGNRSEFVEMALLARKDVQAKLKEMRGNGNV